jgi:hypothetical protein
MKRVALQWQQIKLLTDLQVQGLTVYLQLCPSWKQQTLVNCRGPCVGGWGEDQSAIETSGEEGRTMG